MIQIARFRPLRYNIESISFISRVVAPPYDLIGDKEAKQLRDLDPYNVVHLILGKEGQSPRAPEDYERAAGTLAAWQQERVLFRESVPATYVCEQRFSLHGEEFVRRGFLGAVLLQDPSLGNILPHERTTPEAKADRLRLMEACRANLSPVFAVFSDVEGRVDAVLSEMGRDEPIYEFCTSEPVAYRLWRETDSDLIRRLASQLQREKLLIADGHHRYETALAYSRKHRSAKGPPGCAPEDFLLLFGVSARNKGLKVLPTHRLVGTPETLDAEWLLSTLARYFDIEERSIGSAEQLGALVDQWPPNAQVIGCYLGRGRLIILATAGHRMPVGALSEGPAELQKLPAAVLQEGILKPLLGLGITPGTATGQLQYEADTEQVYWAVESGRFGAAFLLPPVDTGAVAEVARTGQRMPAKTTFFYPKIFSGLLFYPFDDQGSLPILIRP